MVIEKYIKHKRKMTVQAPGLEGFIFSHRLSPINSINYESSKLEFTGNYTLNLSLSFFWLSSCVELHNNPDENLHSSFKTYAGKIGLIKLMCQDMIEHLNLGTGPFVRREFLNDATVNDGFGGTLFMTADPDLPSNYCIFEISSCYKKYRHSGTPKSILKYLKNLVSFINDIEMDLVKVKEKLDQFIGEEEKNGK